MDLDVRVGQVWNFDDNSIELIVCGLDLGGRFVDQRWKTYVLWARDGERPSGLFDYVGESAFAHAELFGWKRIL